MSITTNLSHIRTHIPPQVALVCVSKFNPDEAILEAYNAGERHFGESKVQELLGKFERLPKDIRWHFIGHLQTNKVKAIVPIVHLIHGVDSEKLLKEINKQAEKAFCVVNCLLQVHLSEEETKFGFSEGELFDYYMHGGIDKHPHVRICGVMGMASFTENKEQIEKEFEMLKNIFDKLKMICFQNNDDFKQISMGMSSDFEAAIACGSTMVRIGSSIFGERMYLK
ncbi:MAG: YggS family pyridoxal phosphate enzyme [Porphyromonadaceae bacterium CG2_30_38_12]|nr:MAG: YggS family pyridoxal phosphate enzyme [Porphyromonadaceae bacterium CG2_30_38_12]